MDPHQPRLTGHLKRAWAGSSGIEDDSSAEPMSSFKTTKEPSSASNPMKFKKPDSDVDYEGAPPVKVKISEVAHVAGSKKKLLSSAEKKLGKFIRPDTDVAGDSPPIKKKVVETGDVAGNCSPSCVSPGTYDEFSSPVSPVCDASGSSPTSGHTSYQGELHTPSQFAEQGLQDGGSPSFSPEINMEVTHEDCEYVEFVKAIPHFEAINHGPRLLCRPHPNLKWEQQFEYQIKREFIKFIHNCTLKRNEVYEKYQVHCTRVWGYRVPRGTIQKFLSELNVVKIHRGQLSDQFQVPKDVRTMFHLRDMPEDTWMHLMVKHEYVT